MWSAWLIDLLHFCVSCFCFFFSYFVCLLFCHLFSFFISSSFLPFRFVCWFARLFLVFVSFLSACLLFPVCDLLGFVFPFLLGLMLCERKIYKDWLISTNC